MRRQLALALSQRRIDEHAHLPKRSMFFFQLAYLIANGGNLDSYFIADMILKWSEPTVSGPAYIDHRCLARHAFVGAVNDDLIRLSTDSLAKALSAFLRSSTFWNS